MMSGVVGEVQTPLHESRVSPSGRVDYRSERNAPASTDGSPRGDCKHSSSQRQRQVFPGIAGAGRVAVVGGTAAEITISRSSSAHPFSKC